jgi:hypothetical protein
MSLLRGDEAPARVFPTVRLFRMVSRYQMDSETREPTAHRLTRQSGMNCPVPLDPVRPRGKPASFPHLIGIRPRDPVTM